MGFEMHAHEITKLLRDCIACRVCQVSDFAVTLLKCVKLQTYTLNCLSLAHLLHPRRLALWSSFGFVTPMALQSAPVR